MVVRARINVTGGPLIDDVIIIMHDYVARGMTSTRGRYTARICYVSCAVYNLSMLTNTGLHEHNHYLKQEEIWDIKVSLINFSSDNFIFQNRRINFSLQERSFWD